LVLLIPVDDPADPRLAQFRVPDRSLSNRPQRRDDAGGGMFMAEGDLVVERALDAGCTPVAVLIDGARRPEVLARVPAHVPVYAAGVELRRLLTSLGVPNDVIALFNRPPRPSLHDLIAASTRIVVVEAVDNPANVGAIVRNAAALGWDGLVLDHTSADPLARRALRVSMGHALAFPHARVDDVSLALGEIAAAGFTVVALTPDGAIDVADVAVTGRIALAVGAERAGLAEATLTAAHHRVRIPMTRGVDSLNVAAATAIACYALGPVR
jgi:tRNA G18 (ribose-2'-O)-methylase SpoU